MKKIPWFGFALLFVLVFLVHVLSVMASPVPSLGSVDSTFNASSSTFSVLWAVNNATVNLSCYIFEVDNSGTKENVSSNCWLADTPSGWSNFTITLNGTVKWVNWKVYANDTADDFGVFSDSFYMSHYIIPVFQDDICPVDTLQNTVMYIFIGMVLIGLGIWASYTSILFMSILVGIFGIMYSFPMFACNWVYGLVFLISSLIYLCYEAFLRKFNDE